MDNEKSKTANKSDTAQASVQSTGAAPRERINIQMVQNVLLIWLDSNIDDNNADCRNTITQLRRAVNSISTYTDGEQCIEFLETMLDEKVCMIISGSLGQHMLPRVHDMSQVDSIFIFCGNKKYHEQWVQEWPKIKGVFTDIGSICEALKKAAQQCEQDSMSISIIGTGEDVSKKNFDQLEPSFMYTQIMKEILLTIEFEQQHIDEFIQHCRDALAKNEGELKKLEQFEREYRDKTPIWWYTCECFLYPMLNRALRVMDVDMIIKMGFFIGDLHRHIEQLHQEQFSSDNSQKSFIVYRGQGVPNADFEQMSKNKGGLISFNNFLSTSKKRNVSLDFANGAAANSGMVGILFVMTIDPKQSTTPFASIIDVSCFQGEEDEVLFSMHTVFRIGEMTPMGENNRLFQVNLTLTSDNDKDLRAVTDHIREESNPGEKGWYRLGLVLLKMGQSEKVQQVYETLLGQTTKESDKALIYNHLGWAKDDRGEYTEAITCYEKALEIYKKTLSPTAPNLAACYNNIGEAYRKMGDYPRALSYYEKDLEISKQSLPLNHPDLGGSYNNIGIVYRNMGDYPKALSYYEKALAIQQQSLPPNHPHLGGSYNNIGIVYRKMGDYQKALSYYEKDLEISKQSLPANHPDLGMSYNNIGMVYYSMGDYLKALSYYEKDLEISKQSLPPNHPSLAYSYNNIGLVYEHMKNYSKARSFYELAVDIGQQSLPANHSHLQLYRKNLERVKEKM